MKCLLISYAKTPAFYRNRQWRKRGYFSGRNKKALRLGRAGGASEFSCIYFGSRFGLLASQYEETANWENDGGSSICATLSSRYF